MRLTVVTHSDTLLAPVVGLLLCMPKYVAGTMLLGEVVRAAAAFVVVQGACNWFTDNHARLAAGPDRPARRQRCATVCSGNATMGCIIDSAQGVCRVRRVME